MSVRDDILRCTRDLYLEHGLAGVSLRAVAKCAGVTAPAIYRHFDGKEDLLWSVCQRGHEIFASYLARALKAKTPRARLVASGQAYLDFALEHRPYYMVMFVAPVEHLGFEILERKSLDAGGTTFQMLVDRVRECMDEGVIAPGDPVADAVIIWAHVHGLVSLYARVPEGPSGAELPGVPPPVATPERFRALYDRSVEALLDGLAPR